MKTIRVIEPKIDRVIYHMEERTIKLARGFLRRKKLTIFPEGWYEENLLTPLIMSPEKEFILVDASYIQDADSYCKGLGYLCKTGFEVFEDSGEVKVKRINYLNLENYEKSISGLS